MTRVLVWKELREQAAVVIALTVLGCGVLVSMAVLLGANDTSRIADLKSLTLPGRLGVILLTMTAGLVIGGTLFAGERENGSFLYLDRLPGSRWRIWWRKVIAGVVMASLSTLTIVGVAGPLGLVGARQEFAAWVVIAFTLAAFTFSWGAVGSVHAKTSLAACGLGIVYAIGFLVAAIVLTQIGLAVVSVALPDLWMEYRGLASPAGALVPTFAAIFFPLPISAWLFTAPDRDRQYGTALSIPTPGGGFQAPRIQISLGFLSPRGWFTKTRRMAWLLFRQSWVTAIVLGVIALLSGCTLLIDGAMLIFVWPAISLFMGVLVAVTNLSDEQGTEAARFWGERRLPVGRIWRVKVMTGLAMTFGLCVVMLLPVLFKALVSDNTNGPRMLLAMNTRIIGEPGFPIFAFAFLWPVYGFVFGHLAAMLFRKAIVAGAVGSMVAGVFAALWLPSLYAGGVHGWQLWLPAVLSLVTARMLSWSWATNAIGTRRSLRRLVLGSLFVVGSFAFGIAYRVLEVPEVAEIEDDIRFAETLPSFDEKQAGRDLRRAASLFKDSGLADFDRPLNPPLSIDPNWMEHEKQFRRTGLEQIATVFQTGYPADRSDVDALIEKAFTTGWEEVLRESAKKPTGVMDDPTEMTFDYLLTNLDLLRKMMIVYLAGGLQKQVRGQPEVFVERLELWLSVVRNVKNRSTIHSVHHAMAFEYLLFEAFDRWLEKLDGRPDLLQRALRAVRYHEEQEPYNPQWTLWAEQTRARRAINTPALWMPTYLDRLAFVGSVSATTESQTEADTAAFMWTVPWERERLRRVVGIGNDPQLGTTNPHLFIEQHEFLRGLPGAGMIGMRADLLVQRGEKMNLTSLTYQRGVALKLALRLFHADTGQFPMKLDELVPKYLPKLPNDPHLTFFPKPFGYRVSVAGEAVPVTEQSVRFMPDPDLLNCQCENAMNLANGVSAISGSAVLWGRPPGFFDPLNTISEDPTQLAKGVSGVCGAAVLWDTNNGFFDPFQSDDNQVGAMGMPGGMGGPGSGAIGAGGGGGPGMLVGEVGTLPMIPVPNQLVVPPGYAIIWSVGPDRVDNGGFLANTNPWNFASGDLIFVVPLPAKPGAKKP